MPKFKNIEGERFTRLVVNKYMGKDSDNKSIWQCICDCGNTIVVRTNSLTNGNTKSCGCFKKDQISKSLYKHGMARKQQSRLYKIWCNMIARCHNSNTNHYKYYGARGIKVCKEWMTFSEFMKWAIKNGYNDNLTIERKDIDKDYKPENCTFIPKSQQSNNKSDTHYLTHKGVTLPIAVWAQKLKIKSNTLYSRINLLGWTTDKALSEPVKNQNKETTYE